MTTIRVAAVQASYVLMDRDATLARVEELLTRPEVRQADLVVFPEVFVPGTPIWMDSSPIWVGDEEWFALLADQAVVVPSTATDRLGAAARDAATYLVIGVSEREEYGSTIYNTLLYFGPDGGCSPRTASWSRPGRSGPSGAGGTGRRWRSSHSVRPAGRADLLGELHAAGAVPPLCPGRDIWVAPTLAQGDGWVATLRHLAREGRMWVIGVNPCLHVDQIPVDFPDRYRLWPAPRPGQDGWVEPGNTVICDPAGEVVAGPLRHQEGVLTAELDLSAVAAARRLFDPVGRYNRPDVFRLQADTRARPAVTIGELPD